MNFTATTTSKLARKHVYVTPDQVDGINARSASGNVSTYIRNAELCYGMTLTLAKMSVSDLLDYAGANEAERSYILSKIFQAVADQTDDPIALAAEIMAKPQLSRDLATRLHEALRLAIPTPSSGSDEGIEEAIEVLCTCMLPAVLMLSIDANAGISMGTSMTHTYLTTSETYTRL